MIIVSKLITVSQKMAQDVCALKQIILHDCITAIQAIFLQVFSL